MMTSDTKEEEDVLAQVLSLTSFYPTALSWAKIPLCTYSQVLNSQK